MTLQEKYTAAAIGEPVKASAPDGADGLSRFAAEMVWLNEQQAAGRVRITETRKESYSGNLCVHRVVFTRLA